MIGVNMNNIDAAGDYKRPIPGGYVMRIESVKNIPAKELLEINMDIAEGEHKGYYADLKERFGFWGSQIRQSYKEKALPFFKAFLDKVQESNGNVEGLINESGDVDETKLAGLLIGAVVGERQYVGMDGKEKVSLDWFKSRIMPVNDIREGNFTIPDPVKADNIQQDNAPKVTDASVSAETFGPVNDGDIPF